MRLQWRLKILMAERGIPSAAELSRRLAEVGVERSETQISRLVKAMPNRLDTHVLLGLCRVLDCGPEDLIQKGEDRKFLLRYTVNVLEGPDLRDTRMETVFEAVAPFKDAEEAKQWAEEGKECLVYPFPDRGPAISSVDEIEAEVVPLEDYLLELEEQGTYLVNEIANGC